MSLWDWIRSGALFGAQHAARHWDTRTDQPGLSCEPRSYLSQLGASSWFSIPEQLYVTFMPQAFAIRLLCREAVPEKNHVITCSDMLSDRHHSVQAEVATLASRHGLSRSCCCALRYAGMICVYRQRQRSVLKGKHHIFSMRPAEGHCSLSWTRPCFSLVAMT